MQAQKEMKSKAITKYYEALDRLLKNQPNVLNVGEYNITLDNVSLEANNGRGSIRASKGQMWEDLKDKIELEALSYSRPISQLKLLEKKLANASKKNKALKDELDIVYNYNLNMSHRIMELESLLRKKSKVSILRK